MIDLRNNLKYEMAARSWNAYDLSDRSGVPQSTIQRFLSGKHGEPRDSTIKKLAIGLGIKEAKLRGLTNTPTNTEQRAPTAALNLKNTESNAIAFDDIAGKIPLISWVSAGIWCEAIDIYSPGDAEEWLPCPIKCGHNTFALRVDGDSMTSMIAGNKTYPPGCIIYIDPEVQLKNGDRVVAKLKDKNHVTFKIYREDAGEKWLMPINTQYEKILIDERVTICGVVIAKYEPE